MKNKTKRPLVNEALRLARLYWGYNQGQMADLLGVSQSIISEVESASKSVSMDLLEKYSAALNVKMSNLLFFAEELEDVPNPSRGKTIIATKVLEFLDGIAPKEKASQ
ncbi:MAG: helix-turn-helix transcriptional regulator [Hyphomonadaceae bacterium]